jgi:hypothetical protein
VRDVEVEAELGRETCQQEEQRGGVRAAGDRDDERSWWQEVVLTHEGEDRGADRSSGRQRWLGRDSDPGPVGYESTALTAELPSRFPIDFRTLPRFDRLTSTEFGLGHRGLLAVARAARRNDVLDSVRPSARERHAMIRLDPAAIAAVATSVFVDRQEDEPLRRREVTGCAQLPRTPSLPNCAPLFWVLQTMSLVTSVDLFPVTCLVGAIASQSGLGMVRAPATHRLFGVLAMTLRGALDVRTLIRAPVLRILARHA